MGGWAESGRRRHSFKAPHGGGGEPQAPGPFLSCLAQRKGVPGAHKAGVPQIEKAIFLVPAV